MEKLIIACIALVLAGCASTPMVGGGSQAQADADHAACLRISGAPTGGFIFGPAIIVLPVVAIAGAVNHSKTKAYQTCMLDRGYRFQNTEFTESEAN